MDVQDLTCVIAQNEAILERPVTFHLIDKALTDGDQEPETAACTLAESPIKAPILQIAGDCSISSFVFVPHKLAWEPLIEPFRMRCDLHQQDLGGPIGLRIDAYEGIEVVAALETLRTALAVLEEGQAGQQRKPQRELVPREVVVKNLTARRIQSELEPKPEP